MICITTLVLPLPPALPHLTHTPTHSVPLPHPLDHFPSGPGGSGSRGGSRGPSVCSVTTVIVKQQVQAGPLLRYSQKAVGEESALL